MITNSHELFPMVLLTGKALCLHHLLEYCNLYITHAVAEIHISRACTLACYSQLFSQLCGIVTTTEAG